MATWACVFRTHGRTAGTLCCVASLCCVEGLGRNRSQDSSPLQNTRAVASIRPYHQMFHRRSCELTVEVSSPDEPAMHLSNRLPEEYSKSACCVFFFSVITTNNTNNSNMNMRVPVVRWEHQRRDPRRRAAGLNKAPGTASGIVLQKAVPRKCFDSPSTSEAHRNAGPVGAGG